MQLMEAGRYCGAPVRRRDLGDLIFTESAYRPGQRVTLHAHEHPYVSRLVRGGYRESCGSAVRECDPSTIVFHEPREEHADAFSDRGGVLFRLELRRDAAERRHDGVAWRRAGPTRDPRAALAMTRLRASAWIGDACADLEAEALAWSLFTLEIPGLAARPRWIGAACDYLAAARRRRVTLSEVAAAIGRHPCHVARAFRGATGLTMGDYLRKLRVDDACRRLADDDAPIAAVAAETGFAHQSHLTAAVRRVTGLTPLAWRRRTSVRASR
jgi:AraC family transcriptional regulator